MSLFSVRSPSALASSLLNQQLELPDGRVCTITSVDAFEHTKNDTPTYRAMFSMAPGDVFTPSVMGHPMFLIVCYDGQKIGGCVRVTGLTDAAGNGCTGSGKVGKFVGFSHKQTGKIVERGGGQPLLLQMTGTLTPSVVTSATPKKETAKTRKNSSVLLSGVAGKYLTELSEKYRAIATPEDTFNNWLDKIRAEHNTEAKLKKFLAE